ncbi:MAG: DNA translocase FtsK 4TM domain-containing protein, partial [Pseudomonadota bacterium]|nr:DNA translocase FtsK 4TM domain-containing protein [Pseudomonadota bacterium]
MATRRSIGGVYQPRQRASELADALATMRLELARLLRALMVRGLGLLLVTATLAALVALASYNAADASLDNATGAAPTNLLGGLGATAADLLLQTFGIAAVAALLPPIVWGLRGLMGRPLSYAMWRAIAWPVGAVLAAAGLGVLPAPAALPAGAGGLIGITVVGLSSHAAGFYGQGWLAIGLPLLLLVAGLPLAFLATGLRLKPLLRLAATMPAVLLWLVRKLRLPELSWHSFRRADAGQAEPEEDWEEDETDEDEEDSDDGYALKVKPEPIAATRLAERRESRIKREAAKREAKNKPARQPALNLSSGEYQLPSLGLLAEPVHHDAAELMSDEALEENARMLEAVLTDFGVRGRIVAVRPGPVVTLYEFEPAAGVKSSRVISLADDVARSMSAVAARIAVIPGRNVMGIELPNRHRETVFLREQLASNEFEKARAPLILALGKTIGGEPVMADLAKMPHLLIAGTTGSGKSVAINTMILSLLYRLPPNLCRMIMIDPKMLELSVYEGIPHLLAPVVTDPKKAVVALKWAVREMEERYRKMSKLGVRGVEAFNDRVRKARDKGE